MGIKKRKERENESMPLTYISVSDIFVSCFNIDNVILRMPSEDGLLGLKMGHDRKECNGLEINFRLIK